jgi:SAM-dependent methyltransferase
LNCGADRLSLLVDQDSDYEVLEGKLKCECGHCYQITRGVLRAVSSDSYVGNFSFEWQLHRKTQLDTAQSDHSYRAFCEKTGLDPDSFRGKTVLDVGVGTGRFADVLVRSGATVTGVDLSYAVETAMENVGRRAGVNIVQADLFKLPFAKQSFDLIYSVGVLHHTPDCKNAFRQLVPYLRPGGTIAIWVYDAHVWKPGSILETNNRILRALTTRLPSWLLYGVCLCELPLYALRKIRGFDTALHLLLPGLLYHAIPKFNDHPDVKEHILDVFDWYSPKYQSKHTYPEVFAWFEEAGLEKIRVLPFPVGVSGKMPRLSHGSGSPRTLEVAANVDASN